jgi:hypothetical protein
MNSPHDSKLGITASTQSDIELPYRNRCAALETPKYSRF